MTCRSWWGFNTWDQRYETCSSICTARATPKEEEEGEQEKEDAEQEKEDAEQEEEYAEQEEDVDDEDPEQEKFIHTSLKSVGHVLVGFSSVTKQHIIS